MIIMGIDPGTHITGYGAIDSTTQQCRHVAHGEIKIKRGTPLTRCLSEIYDGLGTVISDISPDIIALENIFYGKNIRSLITQGHARGVIILAAAKANIPLCEYSPLEIKKSVVGYGKAEKTQVQHMVKAILCLPEPAPQDASDALAAAICHAHHRKQERL